MIYYSTSTKLVSENYPYGNLRTTKTDWIEFKKGKGFRHMSQTINPKTGRLNNPKASTYYYIMLLGRDENGQEAPYSYRPDQLIEKFNQEVNTKEQVGETAFGRTYETENFQLFNGNSAGDWFAYKVAHK